MIRETASTIRIMVLIPFVSVDKGTIILVVTLKSGSQVIVIRIKRRRGMMAIKPKILVQGNDLKCVHREYIEQTIGTCVNCGQVRDYGQSEGAGFNTDLDRLAVHESTDAQRARGGQNNNPSRTGRNKQWKGVNR